jgi:hypothetical protein
MDEVVDGAWEATRNIAVAAIAVAVPVDAPIEELN